MDLRSSNRLLSFAVAIWLLLPRHAMSQAETQSPNAENSTMGSAEELKALTPKLRRDLSSDDDELVIRTIFEALRERIRSRDATDLVLQLVESDRDLVLRSRAIGSIGSIGQLCPNSVSAEIAERLLKKITTDSEMLIKVGAIRSLGLLRTDSKEIVEALIKASESEDATIRAATYAAMGRKRSLTHKISETLARGIVDEERIRYLVSLGLVLESPICLEALSAVRERGVATPSILVALRTQLTNKDDDVVIHAAAAMVRVSTNEKVLREMEPILRSFLLQEPEVSSAGFRCVQAVRAMEFLPGLEQETVNRIVTALRNAEEHDDDLTCAAANTIRAHIDVAPQVLPLLRARQKTMYDLSADCTSETVGKVLDAIEKKLTPSD
ncbi:MAG: hypothetical protein GY878_10065 [Fuerstiella sp.]|nr:hypothetical protein [Fuerstiella sp.]